MQTRLHYSQNNDRVCETFFQHARQCGLGLGPRVNWDFPSRPVLWRPKTEAALFRENIELPGVGPRPRLS